VTPGVERSWAAEVRHETPQQQSDRNFNEMLQELRVAQTGTQILFAFLLTLVFSSGFHAVHGAGMVVYAVTVLAAALATCFLIAPVACHRLLFRRHAKDRLVEAAHRLTLVGLALLAISTVGSLLLVIEVALGWTAALLICAAVTVVFALVWVALPLSLRESAGTTRPGASAG